MPLKRHPKYCWAGSRYGYACADDIFELRPATGESTSTFGQDFTPSTGTAHSESSTFDFHRVLFSQEGVQNVRRSRKSTIWWAPEMLWLLFGYLCFIGVPLYPLESLSAAQRNLTRLVAVAVLLAICNGSQPPSLPLGVTLNTLVALLVTLARFAFTVPIVEGFGQLKWTHFLNRGPQPLADFEALDQASRGPWGSFVILVKYKR